MLGVLELEESFDSCITTTLTLCRFKNSPNSVSLFPMPFALRGLCLGVSNSLGTCGVYDVCLCLACGGVGGEWVGAWTRVWKEGWGGGGCYICVSLDYLCR